MEKADLSFWSTQEEFSLLQVGYLWCGFEPPDDIPKDMGPEPTGNLGKLLSKALSEKMGRNLQAKPLPAKVSLTFRQLVDAISDGKLRIKHEQIPYGVSRGFPTNGDNINLYRKVFLSRDALTAYAETTERVPDFLREVPEQSTELKSQIASTQRAFILSGEFWKIIYEGNESSVRNLESIKYITHLLENPDRTFTPVQLTRLVKGGEDCELSGITNEQRSGLSKMSQEQLYDREGLSIADLNIDSLSPEESGRLEEIAHDCYHEFKDNPTGSGQEEWDNAKKYLSDEYGIVCFESENGLNFKRLKRFDHQNENARSNVTKNIRRGIKIIENAMPKLGTHLTKTIKTGNSSSYEPGESLTPWTVTR